VSGSRAGDAGGFEGWLLASLSAGVVAVDAEARLRVLNEGARRILGLPAGRVARGLDRDCRELLRDQPALARLLVESLERGSPLSRAELPLAGGPDCAATIGLTLSPVRDPAGRVCGAAMLFRDLAPIERGDEQERLRDRLAALGEMAAGLAHEIRNPLAGMEVLVGLLRRRLGDLPEERELLAELCGELRAVADVVRESLEYVKPMPPAHGPVDPLALVEEALACARSRVPFEGAVERRFEAALPAVEADEEQLRTLLVNLMVNALQAMTGAEAARSPVLGLGARAGPGGELEICIWDTGPGVAPELREKVFYPFFSTREGGSGVGLALAQKIALSHGGSLELDSAPGGGCAARLHLPAAAPQVDEP
jgi:nitrogen-specific signal transduction histidine kinase